MKPHQFQRQLAQLKGWRETAFILALTERSLPNVLLFSQVAEFQGGIALSDTLQAAWDALLEKAEEETYITLLEAVEENTPDAADYEMYGVVPAIRCCELLEQALLTQVNEEKRRATEAGQLSFDTVMDFVEMSEGEGLSEDELVKLFDKSPLIKREMAFQEELLDTVRKEVSPNEQALSDLRQLAFDDGVSNIGISLDDE